MRDGSANPSTDTFYSLVGYFSAIAAVTASRIRALRTTFARTGILEVSGDRWSGFLKAWNHPVGLSYHDRASNVIVINMSTHPANPCAVPLRTPIIFAFLSALTTSPVNVSFLAIRSPELQARRHQSVEDLSHQQHRRDPTRRRHDKIQNPGVVCWPVDFLLTICGCTLLPLTSKNHEENAASRQWTTRSGSGSTRAAAALTAVRLTSWTSNSSFQMPKTTACASVPRTARYTHRAKPHHATRVRSY